MLYISLPQALRRILPPLAGQFISLIKDSSLLGIIARAWAMGPKVMLFDVSRSTLDPEMIGEVLDVMKLD